MVYKSNLASTLIIGKFNVNAMATNINQMDLYDYHKLANVLAIETKNCVLIIDETEGRRFADLYNLTKAGFIGLLLDAYHKKLINNIEIPLNTAIGKGFWINKNLLKQIFEIVKKHN